MVGDNDQPDPMKPFMVSAWLTASFHEEATLRKYMESWRGAPYTEQQISEFETDRFDWSLMLGVPCMVQMGLNKKGKVKIQNITKLQKNIERAASVNQHIVLILDEYDQKAFEWRELNSQPAPATAAKIISTDAPFDDEIPSSESDQQSAPSGASLLELRDQWVTARNARTQAYRAFMSANKNSPGRKELDAAKAKEKVA